MDVRFQIIFTGKIQPHATPEQVVRDLEKVFKVPEGKAWKLVLGEKEHVLKKNQERERAVRYTNLLQEAGLIVKLEPMDDDLLGGDTALTPSSQTPSSYQPFEPSSRPDPVDAFVPEPTGPASDRTDSSPAAPELPEYEPAPNSEPTSSQERMMPPLSDDQLDTGACPRCGSTRIGNGYCLSCGTLVHRLPPQNGVTSPGDALVDHPAPISEPDDDATETEDAEVYGGEPETVDSESPQYDPTGVDDYDRSMPLDFSDGPISGTPHSVGVLNGLGWIFTGFGMFKKQPITWLVATAISAALVWLCAAAALNESWSLFGLIALVVLAPVIHGGLYSGAHEQATGAGVRLPHLLAGAASNAGGLIATGVVVLVLVLLLSALCIWLPWWLYGPLQNSPFEVLSGGTEAGALPILIGLGSLILGGVLLALSYWHAPALVAIDGMAAMPALKASLAGCLRNPLALVLFAAAWGALWSATLLLGAILIQLYPDRPLVGLGVPFAISLTLLLPVAVTSSYAAYRDVFRGVEF